MVLGHRLIILLVTVLDNIIHKFQELKERILSLSPKHYLKC